MRKILSIFKSSTDLIKSPQVEWDPFDMITNYVGLAPVDWSKETENMFTWVYLRSHVAATNFKILERSQWKVPGNCGVQTVRVMQAAWRLFDGHYQPENRKDSPPLRPVTPTLTKQYNS